jgi:hypothetical protein
MNISPDAVGQALQMYLADRNQRGEAGLGGFVDDQFFFVENENYVVADLAKHIVSMINDSGAMCEDCQSMACEYVLLFATVLTRAEQITRTNGGGI